MGSVEEALGLFWVFLGARCYRVRMYLEYFDFEEMAAWRMKFTVRYRSTLYYLPSSRPNLPEIARFLSATLNAYASPFAYDN